MDEKTKEFFSKYPKAVDSEEQEQSADAVEEVAEDEVIEDDTEGVTGDQQDDIEDVADDQSEGEDSSSSQGDDAEGEESDIEEIELGDDEVSTDDSESAPDYSKLVDSLKEYGVKSKDDIVSKFKESNEKLSNLEKELESLKASNDKLPDKLKEALEIAQEGGDFMEYLEVSSVDYDSIDPKDLAIQTLREQANPKTEAEIEEFQDYIDSMTSVELRMKGNEIKQKLVASRKAKIDEVKRKSIEREGARKQEALKALESFDKVDNFKVSPKYKKRIAKQIENGDIVRRVLGKDDGYDYKKLLEMNFIYENYDSIKKILTRDSKNEKARDIIRQRSNAESASAGSSSSKGGDNNGTPVDEALRILKNRYESTKN